MGSSAPKQGVVNLQHMPFQGRGGWTLEAWVGSVILREGESWFSLSQEEEGDKTHLEPENEKRQDSSKHLYH